jgi:hypothetical protein
LEQSHRGPWIIAKTCLNLAFVRGFDDEQRPLAVSDWAAQEDEAIVYEAVHERRVLVPGMLFPDRERGVPARAVDRCQRKEGHEVNVVMDFEGSIIHAIAERVVWPRRLCCAADALFGGQALRLFGRLVAPYDRSP